MRYGLSAAERERVKLCIDEGKQRVADQRSRLAKLERLGGDTALSKRLLVTFEASLRLMISYGYAIERTPTGVPDYWQCRTSRGNVRTRVKNDRARPHSVLRS